MYSIRHNGATRRVAPGTKVVEKAKRERSYWPAERVEALRQLRLAGLSIDQCAAKLGLTRGQVAGFRDRNRMP